MKNVLIHVRDDAGQPGRLAVGLALGGMFDAHLACVQVTPYTAFVAADPLGGMFVSPAVIETLRQREDAEQDRIEAEIARAGLHWDWLRFDGDAARAITSRAGLADIVIVSLAHEPADDRLVPLPIVGDVAIHAGTPVLALPPTVESVAFDGAALIAWNGSAEAARSLRAALPLLRKAASVHLLAVAGDPLELETADAADYLSRHGIGARIEERAREGGDVASTLLAAAGALDAAYIVMGAYGHSRLRESILGGVTGTLVARSTVPLLLSR